MYLKLNSFLLVLIISLSIVVSSVYASPLDLSETSTKPIGDAINSKYLSILNHSYYDDILFTVVNGSLINNSTNTMNSVNISVEFYDKDGNLITSNSDTANNIILGPGEESIFRINTELGDEEIGSYKVIPGGSIGP